MKEMIDCGHSAGTVGVLCGSLARYRALFTSLEVLKVPQGTKLIYAEGCDIARNCNNLVESMKGEWLWLMGDDHRFDRNILLNLLERRVDIVVPVVSRRDPPFVPVLFDEAQHRYAWDDLVAEDDLKKVGFAGSAGMLIRRRVFSTLPQPWFQFRPGMSEDIGFCYEARQSHYKIYADLAQTMTHVTPCELEPKRDEQGKWKMTVNIGGHVHECGTS